MWLTTKGSSTAGWAWLGRGVWWRWFVTLFVLCTAWGFATPVLSGPDENSHVLRAIALSRGDVTGREMRTPFGRLPVIQVPLRTLELSLAADCYKKRPEVTPACVRSVQSGDQLRPVLSGMAKYPPLYYALVALPVRVVGGVSGQHLMRLVSALLVAALLAAAFFAAQAIGRWSVLGVAVATTPMVLYYGGIVNPSALEIAAAIAVWASAAALARAKTVDERLLAIAVSSYALCVNSRSLALFFASAAVGAGLLLMPRARLREIMGMRRCKLWCAAALLSVVPAVVWGGLYGRFDDVPGAHTNFTFLDGLGRWWRLIQEGTAEFGIFEVRVWASILLWCAVTLALLWIAFSRARRHDGMVLAGVLIVVIMVPIAVSMVQPAPLFAVWPGRIGLPLTVGAAIVAGVIADSSKPQRIQFPIAPLPILAAGVGLAQFFAFATTARRYAVGINGALLYFLDPTWTGPLRSTAVLALGTGAILALTCLVARSTPLSPSPNQNEIAEATSE